MGVEPAQRPVLVQLRLRALRRDHDAHLGSSITLCLGTLPGFEQSAEIQQIEIICGVIFTVEFVARVLVWQGSLHLLLLDF